MKPRGLLADLLQVAAHPLKLLRNHPPDPRQLALPLDLFSPHLASRSQEVDQAAPGPGHIGHVAPLVPVTPAVAPGAPPRGSPGPAIPGQRRLMLGQHLLSYHLRRSKRRTIGFMIDDDGLRITAPKWVGVGEIENAIREKQRWILSKLHEHQERVTRRLRPQMQWREGGVLPYLGTDLMLRLVANASEGIVYDARLQTLTVSLPAEASQQQLKDRVQAWMQQEAKILFAQRLPVYAEKLDVTYRAFALSSATTQWGSCTADGKIRLNWRLMHFALPLIDYVIAHELSHLREMNHGPRFWATVQSAFPEFAAAKKALRDHAPETLPAF